MNPQAPSAWVVRHLHLLPAGCRILDLACGSGRHTRLLHERGHPVLAVDIDISGVADLQQTPGIELRELDLEGDSWPLGTEQFGGIIVTNYLHRPRLAQLSKHLSRDGVLIYATFAAGNERFGRPRNPDFLLQPGELEQVFGADLHVIAVEEETVTEPSPAVRQRLCAVGPDHPAAS